MQTLPEWVVIAAVTRNRVIGRGNDLVCWIKEDLQRFRALTMGHTVVMGRKTAESLPKRLDGRRLLVLTRDPLWQRDGFEAVADLATLQTLVQKDGTVFIGGGEAVYRLLWPLAARLELTEIAADAEGDRVFPDVDGNKWRETARIKNLGVPDFDFVTYRRTG